jgi:hypothetical protein
MHAWRYYCLGPTERVACRQSQRERESSLSSLCNVYSTRRGFNKARRTLRQEKFVPAGRGHAEPKLWYLPNNKRQILYLFLSHYQKAFAWLVRLLFKRQILYFSPIQRTILHTVVLKYRNLRMNLDDEDKIPIKTLALQVIYYFLILFSFFWSHSDNESLL